MYIDASTIITLGSLLGALGLMLGLILKGHKWVLHQEEQDKEIAKLKALHEKDTDELKQENRLVCEALSACLDGLQQLGANHDVPKVKSKLDEYLNAQAHK